MNKLRFGLCALSFCAAALIAGCGGSQPPTGALDAIPQSRTIAAHTNRGGSWMLPQAKNKGALLYVTGGCGGTCVLSYPRGKLVGQLNVGGGDNGGICTDAHSNVYISNSTSVVEYVHGGTSPIATFNLPGSEAAGCSIDATTGNLAVDFQGSGGNIAIFPPGSDNPSVYESNVVNGFSCSYDEDGDLFAGGLNGQASGLTELPAGGSKFLPVSMPNIGNPGHLQWVGGYLAYETIGLGDTYVYRLTISGSTATVAGTTHIIGPRFAYFSWIYGKKVIIPYTAHGTRAQNVGVWRFPNGGAALIKYKKFGGAGADLQSLVISPA